LSIEASDNHPVWGNAADAVLKIGRGTIAKGLRSRRPEPPLAMLTPCVSE
jgi:hypothetical protein